MRRSLAIALSAMGALLLVLMGCGAGGGASDKDVLISLTDEVVVPAYESVAQDVAQLDRDVVALCNAPSASSLEVARQSWRKARASWMKSEAMWFGPIMDRRSLGLLDWSPTDVEGIDRMLAEGRDLTAFEVREVVASNLRGFGAIEYLLFDSDVLADHNGSGFHCSYLTALTAVAREETGSILSDWLNGTDRQPAYKDYFTDRASLSILPSAAVSDVVRTQVFLIREIVDMRLASALGLRGDAPDLSMLPGTAADNSLDDLRNNILGMQAMYEGRGEQPLAISDLVRPLSEDTDQRLRDQFDATIAAIDGVPSPLPIAMQERPDLVRNVYDSLQNVQVTISTEMVSLLGVSVGFTDTDGDSQR